MASLGWEAVVFTRSGHEALTASSVGRVSLCCGFSAGSSSGSVIRALSAKGAKIAFLLWGSHAAAKRPLIDEKKHLVVVSAHPSPLSARRGFFGSRPFSRVTAFNGMNWIGEE